jgi:hypothetical protein
MEAVNSFKIRAKIQEKLRKSSGKAQEFSDLDKPML